MTKWILPFAELLLLICPMAAHAQQPTDYGFGQWLNVTRAQHGLPAVGYDANMTNWAAVNNQHQQAKGMGHHVIAPARRQNSAWNYRDIGTLGAAWMNSPGHRAALLDPTITAYGIAFDGLYWTFNAR